MEKDRSIITAEFLKSALKSDNDPILQVARREANNIDKYQNTRHSDVMSINLLGTYLAFSDSTLQKLSDTYGISRQAINQRMDETIARIWNDSPQEIKEKYPLGDLMKGRFHKLKGEYIRAANMIKEGKDADEIRNELDIDVNQLSLIRRSLRGRGIELGYIMGEAERIAENIEKTETDEETQLLLNKIDRKTLTTLKRIKDKKTMPVMEVIMDSDYFPSNREVFEFVDVIKKSGIPLGEIIQVIERDENPDLVQHYYFIATKDKERARAALMEAQELNIFKENHVKKICGPENAVVPRVGELRIWNYGSIGNVLEELGIFTKGHSKIKTTDLLSADCPVAVFKYSVNYYYDLEDKELLKDFLSKRVKELRKLLLK